MRSWGDKNNLDICIFIRCSSQCFDYSCKFWKRSREWLSSCSLHLTWIFCIFLASSKRENPIFKGNNFPRSHWLSLLKRKMETKKGSQLVHFGKYPKNLKFRGGVSEIDWSCFRNCKDRFDKWGIESLITPKKESLDGGDNLRMVTFFIPPST